MLLQATAEGVLDLTAISLGKEGYESSQHLVLCYAQTRNATTVHNEGYYA